MRIFTTRHFVAGYYFLIMVFFVGCADPTPKVEDETSEAQTVEHEEVAGRIMFEHGVDRASLVTAIRSVLKEGNEYVSKICVRLNSKCPEVHVHEKVAAKVGEGSEGDTSKSDDSESAGKDSSASESGDSKESEADEPTISTSISAGSPEGEKEKEADKQEEEEALSKEANQFMDIVFELGQTFPSLIPHLKDASIQIAQEYPKKHGSETSENVEIYTPLQLMRIYFDLILRMHGRKEPLDPGTAHIYSTYSFEILRSVAVALSPSHNDGTGHVPHEIQALTKASEILKPVSLNMDDPHNTARRIVVKIFLAISDMFVLVRGLVNGPKITSALVKLFDTCETSLESVPESLDFQLRNLNDVKNKLWHHRSDLFKNGKIDEHSITEIRNEIVAIVGGERTGDTHANPSLDQTVSADTRDVSESEEPNSGTSDHNSVKEKHETNSSEQNHGSSHQEQPSTAESNNFDESEEGGSD